MIFFSLKIKADGISKQGRIHKQAYCLSLTINVLRLFSYAQSCKMCSTRELFANEVMRKVEFNPF